MSLQDKALKGVACLMGAIDRNIISPICKYRINETSKSVGEFLAEQSDKEDKLKRDKPLLWAAKKIGQGALKGLLGVSFSKD